MISVQLPKMLQVDDTGWLTDLLCHDAICSRKRGKEAVMVGCDFESVFGQPQPQPGKKAEM